MRLLYLAALPAVVEAAPKKGWYRTVSWEMEEALNKEWEAQASGATECKGYYQSPIAIPYEVTQLGTAFAAGNVTSGIEGFNTATPITWAQKDVGEGKGTWGQHTKTKAGTVAYQHWQYDLPGLNTDKRPYITVGGTKRFLRQFHWHFPSEHAIQQSTGKLKFYDGEIHFVFVTETGGVMDTPLNGLVLNAFIESVDLAAATQPDVGLFDWFLAQTIQGSNPSKTLEDVFQQFFPIWEGDVYRYQGGLTTPGCNEVVDWHVFKTPLKVKEATIAGILGIPVTNYPKHGATLTTEDTDMSYKYTPVSRYTNRPIQPIHGREVTKNELVNKGYPKVYNKTAKTFSTADQKAYNYKLDHMWTESFKPQKYCPFAGNMSMAVADVAAAKHGFRQSPIDYRPFDTRLTRAGGDDAEAWWTNNVWTNAVAQKWHVVNTGHGFNWHPQTADGEEYSKTYKLTMKDSAEEYKLAQFHIHFPSEFRINGEQFTAEIHFVHMGSNGKAAVLAFMLQYDPKIAQSESFLNELFGANYKHLGHKKQQNITTATDIDVKALFHKKEVRKQTILRWEGGLTTPGCDEIVSFFAIPTPVGSITEQDIRAFRMHYADNARDTFKQVNDSAATVHNCVVVNGLKEYKSYTETCAEKSVGRCSAELLWRDSAAGMSALGALAVLGLSLLF